MRQTCRWILLVSFLAMSGYLFLWSVQSASFSVAEDGFARALLEFKSIVLFPVSLLSAAVGVIFFLILAPVLPGRDRAERYTGT